MSPLRDPRAARRRTCVTLAMLAAGGWTRAQPASTLVFGMVPYLPVAQLSRLYEPVVGVFEHALARTVQLQSAPDFEQFIEMGRRGEFDLVGASPHVARLLQREAGYVPLARATAQLRPLILVAQDSPVVTPKMLAGQRVLIADRSALHVLVALRSLRDLGLDPVRDLELVLAGNQRNAVQRMLHGEGAAAVASEVTLSQLPSELTGRARVLLRAPPALTPMAYLVHPRHGGRAAVLRRELLAFPATPAGRAMLAASQHDGLVALDAAELATVDPLVTEYFRNRAAR